MYSHRPPCTSISSLSSISTSVISINTQGDNDDIHILMTPCISSLSMIYNPHQNNHPQSQQHSPWSGLLDHRSLDCCSPYWQCRSHDSSHKYVPRSCEKTIIIVIVIVLVIIIIIIIIILF